ncbi:putative Vitelline membrane outer layer protein 1-like protein [Hypsibius exemplaris]|uniref:Vitelline membrane outer layer protein 1-like protein n=1 Tax=Hypsibius exemplaris TaxID=2072580 RepID=A0A1W0XBC4_HYPEX|nr:putative Vitelline membrane outer layer protein 1-like protein [Hypsibius exemplaris]
MFRFIALSALVAFTNARGTINFDGNKAELTSPGYPNPYGNSINDITVIAEPPGSSLNAISAKTTVRTDVIPSSVLTSPLVTNWGDWTVPSYCGAGHFVGGMVLRTEGSIDGDDTALNAIRFLCNSFRGNGDVLSTATPHQGYWGGWGREFRCTAPDYAIGFELRSEPSINGDDTAGNNLRLICADYLYAQFGIEKLTILEGDGTGWGYWTGQQKCPRGSALCGLKVQIEHPIDGDDTALNNVAAYCCTLPKM